MATSVWDIYALKLSLLFPVGNIVLDYFRCLYKYGDYSVDVKLYFEFSFKYVLNDL